MLRSLAISSSFVCLLAVCHPATAQLEGIKSRIPTDANAVVIINASKLFSSSAAEDGRWEARRDAAFEAGLTYLSPKTTGVVIAANIDVEYGKTVYTPANRQDVSRWLATTDTPIPTTPAEKKGDLTC